MFARSETPTDGERSEPAQRLTDPDWAWASYEPDAQRPWDLRRAGHLYRRAAFGANWGRLQRALDDGPQRSVEKLMVGDGDVAGFSRSYDNFEAAAAGSGSAETLRAWWLRRMVHTPHPLLEKMTLFWHNHFATSNVKVKSALLMQRHVQLLRSHALGRFEPLLAAVSRDPAVLLWLDSTANRKSQPNENYARELLGRFGLGMGHYSQTDISEAARAFTGLFVLRNRLRYIPREHDDGLKKVLGQQGNFEGDDVVRIVLEQPAAPRLLVRKLYRWLISESDEPDETLIAPLAKSFAPEFDVAHLVRTMLGSNLFFSAAAYRRRIKCPVEFALGIVCGLEGTVSTTQLGQDLAAMGQNLYHPPTVKGWPGGRHWISRSTLVRRSNLATALLGGSEKPYGDKLNPLPVARRHGHDDPDSAARFLLDLFLQGDVTENVRETLKKAVAAAGGDKTQQVREMAHGVVALPEFQLA